ncbi:hypothetical protein CTI12_AA620190 [Artemisia annua]|uniref:Uncharacterized protein n=1 Tax=Artemisia annua TaxID=35608 RepID=A0A2U1KC31_ARTAN|nr:hypothetical protein CTI12_AA620190 [Artemisia annua]
MDDLVDDYDQALSPLRRCSNISSNLIDDLLLILYKLHLQKRFSEPIPTIGMYIALASLAIAVKLPMDLTIQMPGVLDQQAKLGSVAFMCIMMAFLLPSLANMNGMELATNITALGVLIITLVVNVCIQINTGLISHSEDMHITEYDGAKKSKGIIAHDKRAIAILYVAMLLMLLMIYICTALMILKSKQVLESKYQEMHKSIQQQARQLTVVNLKQHVIKYGVMATTGSTQLVTYCSVTTSASEVIGFLIFLLHHFTMPDNIRYEIRHRAHDSEYKWSILGILIIQYIGIILGATALLYRFDAPIEYMLAIEGIRKLIKFYRVESCWTDTLSDWRHNRLYSSPKLKHLIYKLQIFGLSILTHSQKAIVMTCKAIIIIPMLIAMCAMPPLYLFLDWLLLSLFRIQVDRRPEQVLHFAQYVLQPQDRNISARTLNSIINSVKCSNQNAERQQPSELMRLIQNVRDFKGVIEFDSLDVQSNYRDCWSLPVVTLATIALSLHEIQPGVLEKFQNVVSDGLVYVKLVEKNLNHNDELVSVQKAAERLWLEIEVYHTWLKKNLKDPELQEKTAIQIVGWFRDNATNMELVVGHKSICASSMGRITKTILLSNGNNIDEHGTDTDESGNDTVELSQEALFIKLSSMIADILAACLTNLPQVIVTKCHESVIEKREESVHAAATLLGKTSEIINTLQARQLPNLNPDDSPFIDKWRDHLRAQAP